MKKILLSMILLTATTAFGNHKNFCADAAEKASYPIEADVESACNFSAGTYSSEATLIFNIGSLYISCDKDKNGKTVSNCIGIDSPFQD